MSLALWLVASGLAVPLLGAEAGAAGEVCFTETHAAEGLNAARRGARHAAMRAVAMAIGGAEVRSTSIVERKVTMKRERGAEPQETSEETLNDESSSGTGGVALPPLRFRWIDSGTEPGEPPRAVVTAVACADEGDLRRAEFDLTVERLKAARDAVKAAADPLRKAELLAEFRGLHKRVRARASGSAQAEAVALIGGEALQRFEAEAARTARIGAGRFRVYIQGPYAEAVALKSFIIARSTGAAVSTLFSPGVEVAEARGIGHPALRELLKEVHAFHDSVPAGLSATSYAESPEDLRINLARRSPGIWERMALWWSRDKGTLRAGAVELYAAADLATPKGTYVSPRSETVAVVGRTQSKALIRFPEGPQVWVASEAVEP